MRLVSAVTALCLALAACLPALEEKPATAVPPAAATRIDFLDTMSFDQDLSNALTAQPPEVRVVPLAPVNLNAMPERLDKWLSAIRQSGGAVRAQAAKGNGRGILGAGIDVVVALFDLGRERVLYAPAAAYDATIQYDKASGTVGEIILARRGTAAAAEPPPAPAPQAQAPVKPAPQKPAKPKPPAAPKTP